MFGDSCPASEVIDYLEELLHAPGFRASARRARLLRYLVLRTLAGEAERINEYAIGVDVFDKPATFDPKLDAIVRAEVSRLRRNLADYYSGAGNGDRLVISLPARGCSLLFTPANGQVQDRRQQSKTGQAAAGTTVTVGPHNLVLWSAVIFAASGALIALVAPLHRSWKPPAMSFAVLPVSFAPSAGDLRQLSGPLTDLLTDSLAQVPSGSVLGTWMVADLKGPGAFQEARAQFPVALILQTTIARQNGRLSVKLILKRGSDGKIEWSSYSSLPSSDENSLRAHMQALATSSIQIAAERESYYLANARLEKLTAQAPFPDLSEPQSPCSSFSGLTPSFLKRNVRIAVTMLPHKSQSYDVRIPFRIGSRDYFGTRATLNLPGGKPVLVSTPELVQLSGDTCVRAGYSGTVAVYPDGCFVPQRDDTEVGVNYSCSAKSYPLTFSEPDRSDSWFPALSPSGAVLLGGIPFVIPRVNSRFWRGQFVSQGSPHSVTLRIPVNHLSVTTAYLLLNTEWGQPGPESYLTIGFLGSRGAHFEKRLIGGIDVRDYHHGIYTNVIDGTTSRAVFNDGRENRIDLVEIALPPEFHQEGLTTITVTDTGRFGFQRAVLWALTVH